MTARVLVLDAHTNQALACVRSLGRAGAEVLVASHRRWPLAGWSRFSRDSFRLAGQSVPAFAELRAWAERHEVDVVLPLTERACILCNAERAAWERAGIIVGCGPDAMLLPAFDKARTIEHAARCGVAVPVTRAPDSLASARSAADAIGFPCVVKPRFSNAWDGAGFLPDLGTAYVAERGDLDAAVLARRQGAHWPLIQRFVPGQGKGVFALCHAGEVVAWFAHERLRDVRPSGSGSSLRRSAALSERLCDPAARLLAELEWHGPAMVEFRDDAIGPPSLMEVNGRFWGSLQLAIEAGVDFPALWLRILRGETLSPASVPDYRAGVTVRWLWGDVKRFLYILQGAPRGYPGRYPTLWQGLRELFGAQPAGTRLEVWSRTDPWPAVGEWVEGVRDLLAQGHEAQANGRARGLPDAGERFSPAS